MSIQNSNLNIWPRLPASTSTISAPLVHDLTQSSKWIRRMHRPTNRPLYQDDPSNTPLGTNFNTKLASVFLVSCHWNNAEIKSAKVRKGQNLQFLKVVASFQENERFTVAHRSLFVKMNFVRFLPANYQNESTLDDWSVIVQSARWLELCNVLYIIRDR